MFRRLRANQRSPKAKERKPAPEEQPSRIDPALSMALDQEQETQFSYPPLDDEELDALLQEDIGPEKADSAAEIDALDSDRAGIDDVKLDDTKIDAGKLGDALPAERRRKLARAAASLPKAVDGVVTVKRGEGRKMVVGQEICLSGEIKSCDSLVVEGRVEADLTDCTALEVMSSGVVKGNATVEHCEISGIFEGDLTAHRSVLVRKGGRVFGNVSYAELEVERGGKITGRISEIAGAPDKPEAKLTEASEDTAAAAPIKDELEEERARLRALQATA